jgi:DeoR/GlpR family transcriptional regulator of sugar metabolism
VRFLRSSVIDHPDITERALAQLSPTPRRNDGCRERRIAQAALRELPAEGVSLLDAGTTTARLAELLPTDRELTVVTNALPIAITLAS